MNHSIKVKFFAAICGVSFAFVLVLTLLNVFFYDDYYRYERKNALAELYTQVEKEYTGEFTYENYTQLADLENRTGARITILGKSGIRYDTTLLQNNTGLFQPNQRVDIFRDVFLVNNALSQADATEIAKKGFAYVTVESGRKDDQYLCLVGQMNGDSIVARIPYAQLQQNSSFNLFFLLITSIFTLSVCMIISYFLSKQFTAPLLQIGAVADTMSRLDFSQKYEGAAKDEIGQLGASINLLSEHLEAAISDLQQSNTRLASEIEEKERIDALRREFIINVSHELKTPIAVIQGYAEGLKLGVAENSDDRRYYCETIADEAARMNDMVMQLLQLSKLELGRETPEPEDVDLDELCRDIIEKTAVLWREKQQIIDFEDTNLHLTTDEGMLAQVVTNYVTNAVRYAPESGKIVLRAVREPDGATTLSVMNEGAGLAEEELEKIWEKFYRTDKARARADGGTGIGLSIVRAVADTLGGTCGAQNVEGGIEFWFRLPKNLEENTNE